VHLGFDNVVVAMPHVANEDHQTCEVGDLTAGQRCGGEEEGRDLLESIQQDEQVHTLIFILQTLDEITEFRRVEDALELSSIERLRGGPFLGTVDVRGSGLAIAHKDGEVGGVVALREFFCHELYQLISEPEKDVQRERHHPVVQEGENGCVHHALETVTRPLSAVV